MTKQETPAQAAAKRRRHDTSADSAMLQAIWLRAYRAEDPIVIPCGTETEQRRLRTALYNAIRNVKTHPEEYPSLVDPVAGVEVVVEKSDLSTLIVRRKLLSPRMQAIRGILANAGVIIADEELRGTPETREAAESSNRLLASLGVPAPAAPPPAVPAENSPRPANPFYSRG